MSFAKKSVLGKSPPVYLPSQRQSWSVPILALGVVLHAVAIACLLGGIAGASTPHWLRTCLIGLIGFGITCMALAAYDLSRFWAALVPVVGIKALAIVALPLGAWLGWFTWIEAIGATAFDLFWLSALAMIAFEGARPSEAPYTVAPLGEALESAKDQWGESVSQLSAKRPTLVVCLRHFGCTFCRETLSDIAGQRRDIESHGGQIALVHMSTDDEAEHVLGRYGLSDVHRVSDPLRRLYRSLELGHGTFSQLFGWRVWARGYRTAVVEKHGLGKLMGDGFQMPGVFLIWNGRILRAYRHKSASDRPNYRDLAECGNCSA